MQHRPYCLGGDKCSLSTFRYHCYYSIIIDILNSIIVINHNYYNHCHLRLGVRQTYLPCSLICILIIILKSYIDIDQTCPWTRPTDCFLMAIRIRVRIQDETRPQQTLIENGLVNDAKPIFFLSFSTKVSRSCGRQTLSVGSLGSQSIKH